VAQNILQAVPSAAPDTHHRETAQMMQQPVQIMMLRIAYCMPRPVMVQIQSNQI